MKVLHRISYVQIVGRIWQPSVGDCACEYTLREYDVQNMRNEGGTITREDVADWLGKNAGDFQSITGFCASIELGEDTVDIPWNSEENEMMYLDCMSERDSEDKD